MADQHDHHNHHHQHRPHRISVPPRAANSSSLSSATTTTTTTRAYPSYPVYNASTPTPTPSKHRLSSSSSSSSSHNKSSSLSFLFLLLFSLRSLYSLLPFLRSSPSSFSLFPFSFLVSLLSFLLTLSFSLLSPSSSSTRKDPFLHKPSQPIFSLSSITPSQHKLFLSKSLILAIVFLLRFQALRYCGTSALILAELSGNVAARFVASDRSGNQSIKVRGLIALLVGLLLLSFSWDRIDCFPLSSSNFGKLVLLREGCGRVLPMLLPFMSGFLGCYERVSMNWGTIRQLGQKRIRLISLFFTTVWLFIPAVISIIVFEAEGDSVSIRNMGWPLANTVVFGVLLSENFSNEKILSSKDFQREFLVTFVCTIVLELFYFPELSLWGLLVCGLFLWIAVRELDPVRSNYLELGVVSSESFTSLIMKPIRQILSERKSRKIALFLLINTVYMVVEFVAGFMSNSLGLISDACHMLFDCAALAIGLYASYISRLPANNQFNYGRGRFEVLSGYVNAVFLVLVGALIVLESLERILDPQEISTKSLLTVSIGGLVVNVVGLIFFHEEHHHAHGGAGACSHSHSHSHSHHHSHDHVEHDHKSHHAHLEALPVSDDSHEKLSIGHVKQHTDGHEHHDCNHNHLGHTSKCTEEPKIESTKGFGHHHDHHQHDHHEHDHHEHDSHHHHEHDHHEHDSHHHHEHDHHEHHAHSSIPLSSSTSLHSHYSEGHTGGENHFQGDSHTHTHSSSGIGVSQLSKLPSDGRLLEEPKKHQHHHIDHNMQGIFLHVLADTLGSVGVVISTLLIKYKGWLMADPACSIFISILIVGSVIPLLRNSAEILLQRVPRAHEQDMKEALDDVLKIKGVRGIQNLHVWSFTNSDVVGTLHLRVSTDTDKTSIQADVSHILHDAGIKDLTLQVESVKSSSS